MPRLNVVLGGNGSGKTTWAREHRDTLPKHFYDADSIANSLGDWNDEAYLFEARDIIDQRVEARLAKQEDFGFESTYSGQSRPAIVEKAKKSGYEVTCIFIGTETPDINVERVRARAEAGTGHAVPEDSIRYRWKASQQNLVKTFHLMNHMKIIDNSEEKPITVLEYNPNTHQRRCLSDRQHELPAGQQEELQQPVAKVRDRSRRESRNVVDLAAWQWARNQRLARGFRCGWRRRIFRRAQAILSTNG